MFIFEWRCRYQCLCRDANVEISKWPFIDLSGFTYFAELLNGCFWTLKDKDLFRLHDFLTILTVVTILAKFGTNEKCQTLVYYGVVWRCFFEFSGLFEDYCDICERGHVWNCPYDKWQYFITSKIFLLSYQSFDVKR